MPAIALLLEQAGVAAAAITPEIIAAVEALIARGMAAEAVVGNVASRTAALVNSGIPAGEAALNVHENLTAILSGMGEAEAGTAATAATAARGAANVAARGRAAGTAAARRVRGSVGPAAQSAAQAAAAPSKLKAFGKAAGANVAGIAAFSLLAPLFSRMIEGSPEDQMRHSMEIQEKLEAERMGRMGGGAGGEAALLAALGQGGYGDVEGLVGRGEPMDSTDLKYNNEFTQHVSDLAYKMKKMRNARPASNNELERIIAGESARIASLQSERVLTPLEIIQFAEMSHGAIP